MKIHAQEEMWKCYTPPYLKELQYKWRFWQVAVSKPIIVFYFSANLMDPKILFWTIQVFYWPIYTQNNVLNIHRFFMYIQTVQRLLILKPAPKQTW